MAFLQINGVDMPTPSTFSIALSDLDSDSTKRNEQGILQRDRIRQGIYKLSCNWNALSQADASLLLHAVSSASFSVTYPDPLSGTNTITAYVGDRTPDMVSYQNGQPRWTISFDLIEY
jgi:hypothetical protein